MNKVSRITRILSIFLVLGLFTIFGYFIWIVSTRFVLFLESANPSVSAAVVGAASTVLVGIGGVLYTQAKIKEREIEEAHRARKIEIYHGFLEMIARIIVKDNRNVSLEAPSEQELIDFLVNFKTNLILWGSPKVIDAQLNFEEVSRQSGNILLAVDELYKAIREDIGLSNRGLTKSQLVKMYLKDPKELDERSASNKALRPKK